MKYLISAILFLFGGSVMTSDKGSCNNPKIDDDKNTKQGKDDILDSSGIIQKDIENPPDDTTAVSGDADGQYTRNELTKMLEDLKKSKAPAELSPGAMCYDMAGPSDRIEYVCPICGSKTLYTDEHNWFLEFELNECRQYGHSLLEHGVKLDESNYCSKCTDNNPETRGLCIYVNYKNEEEDYRCCSVGTDDLRLLNAFFAGKLKYRDDQDFEISVKEKSERLEELLNINIED